MRYWNLNTADELDTFLAHRSHMILAGKKVCVKFEAPETHNWTQFKAMHRWFELIAKQLNDAGMDQRRILKESVLIEWDKDSVKRNLWKPVQKAMTGKESTKDIDGTESGNIQETLCRHFGEKFGIELVEWPHESP